MNGARRSGTIAEAARDGTTAADLHAALAAALAPEALAWLDAAAERVTADPRALGALFPAVGRHCGRGTLEGGPAGWTVDDAGRTILLAALRAEPAVRGGEVEACYRHGDAAERRGVLRALPLLDLRDRALPLVEDALRTSDTRLIQAALGPYGAEHLDQALWRQAVLKCVFNEIPLDTIAGLDERADADLARMLADFARERIAAGRSVPADVWPVIDRFEGTLERSGILAELDSDVPARRAAAQRALADRR
jgi:hypothetical protein